MGAGHVPQRLPAQAEPPLPEITAAQLREQAIAATEAERAALAACVADLQVAEILGGMAPDCRPVAEAYQLAREQAEQAIRARVVVTP